MATAKKAPAPVTAPEFTIRFLDPTTLTPHPLNDKQHPARQKAELTRSLEDFGWLSAPIWNQRTGHLLDGHERREEAIAHGWTPIPVRVVDVDARVERRMLASFDRIGELRERDDRLLARLLQEAMVEDETPPPGFSDAEVDDLEALIEPPAELEPEASDAFHAENPFAERAEQQQEQGPYVAPVRLVNLYLTPDQHAQVLAEVDALAEVYGTANLTDTVVAAVQEAWEQGHAPGPEEE